MVYAVLERGRAVPSHARRMLDAALEAKVEAYIAGHAGERDDAGRRLVVVVVRNGQARARQVTTVAGAIEVRPLLGSPGGATVTHPASRLHQRCVSHNPWPARLSRPLSGSAAGKFVAAGASKGSRGGPWLEGVTGAAGAGGRGVRGGDP